MMIVSKKTLEFAKLIFLLHEETLKIIFKTIRILHNFVDF